MIESGSIGMLANGFAMGMIAGFGVGLTWFAAFAIWHLRVKHNLEHRLQELEREAARHSDG